jgi:hypothetical protein
MIVPVLKYGMMFAKVALATQGQGACVCDNRTRDITGYLWISGDALARGPHAKYKAGLFTGLFFSSKSIEH